MQIEAKNRPPGGWPEPVETSALDSRDRDLENGRDRESQGTKDEGVIVEMTGLIVLILVLAAAAVWLLNCKVKLQWPFGP